MQGMSGMMQPQMGMMQAPMGMSGVGGMMDPMAAMQHMQHMVGRYRLILSCKRVYLVLAAPGFTSQN